jgi:glycerol dehydrogenase
MKYVQGEGAWQRLHEYAAALGQKGAYAVAGPHVLEHYWSDVEKGFKEANFPLHAHRFAGECSMNEINRIVNELREENCDVIIGIGGGKTLDTAKAVGFYANLPVIIAPSIASTDAPCSALSVIYTDEGAFESYLFLRNNPNVVLVDTAVIARSPVRMLVAGMGDALATYYEARACFNSGGRTTAACFVLSALAVARACRDSRLKTVCAPTGGRSQNVSSALDDIVETNTFMCGFVFQTAAWRRRTPFTTG